MEQKLDEILAMLAKLEAGQSRIENKLDTFQEQFNEHEVKDANRHIEILQSLNAIQDDLTTLEDVSGKNLRDIASLKRAK